MNIQLIKQLLSINYQYHPNLIDMLLFLPDAYNVRFISFEYLINLATSNLLNSLYYNCKS